MMKIMQLFLLIICLLFSLATQAQKLTIDSMQATNDLSASQQRRHDLNGEPCALVKVQLAATDVTFEGNVIPPVEYKGGEYWVYMTQGSKELRIKHQALPPTFLPCHVKFTDYGIKDIQSLTTYDLILLLPQTFPSIPQTVSNPGVSPTNQESGNNLETFKVNGVSFNMVRVDGGTFTMGATSEQGSGAGTNEMPAHQVTLSIYSIGETEVTQALWKAVMGKKPSNWKGDNLPVEQVSWDDCQKFITKLNKLTGRRFRLPTEAEWEYAARGGSKSRGCKYSGSNNIGDVAWYDNNSSSQTHPVKTKLANELGLYDMSGNVWEWCQDRYGKYSGGSQTNPTGPSSGSLRVFRGGSWNNDARICRVSFRGINSPDSAYDSLGLRLAL